MGIFIQEKTEGKTEAVRPNSFFTLPSFMRNSEVQKKGLTDDEMILGAGAETAFWKTLKKRIDIVTEELDEVNNVAIASGVTLEEIGRNTVVINLTKGVLRKIFNIVNDARDAVATTGK